MRDFTLHTYRMLLSSLSDCGYKFISFEQYLTSGSLPARYVILRHDIDKRANMALAVAAIEKSLNAGASYYFRCVDESNRAEVIRKVVDMGFEIGYHYEDMSICEGNLQEAKAHFAEWLGYFRQFYPVRTICMHGAPQFRHDSRELWKTVDYHDFGVIGEPYFDVDFSQVVYLTDTGRRWDGFRVSVRDKIPEYQDQWQKQGWVYHTTHDIITAAKSGTLPPHLMITTHPQRWTDNIVLWLYEAVRQTSVNMIKRILIRQMNK